MLFQPVDARQFKTIRFTIEALRRLFQQSIRLRQSPCQPFKLQALVFPAAFQPGYQPPLVVEELSLQISAHRYGHFCRCCRRWRPYIRSKIDQRGISFMPNGRDQRNITFRCRPDNDLFVKGPQIFKTTATPAPRLSNQAAARRRQACRR